jgi:hypothetical protein
MFFWLDTTPPLLPVAAVFFYHGKRIFPRFKPFSIRSYIIYHSRNKNAADEKIGKNNFRPKKC